MTSQRNAAGGATPTAPNDLLRSTSMVPHADTAVEVRFSTLHDDTDECTLVLGADYTPRQLDEIAKHTECAVLSTSATAEDVAAGLGPDLGLVLADYTGGGAQILMDAAFPVAERVLDRLVAGIRDYDASRPSEEVREDFPAVRVQQGVDVHTRLAAGGAVMDTDGRHLLGPERSRSRPAVGKDQDPQRPPVVRHTGQWLDGQEFAPLQWVVPGIIPEGYTLLVGAPKIGKSWWALSICLALAADGARVLGSIDSGPARPVLYLALEDGHRRLQDRARTILGRGAAIPSAFSYVIEGTPEALLEEAARFVTEHSDQCPVVVVDTVQKARPTERNAKANAYQADYAFGSMLKRITDPHQGSSLIGIHHTNKGARSGDYVDSVSGSHGFAGSADAVLILSRERGEDAGRLNVTGRDVEEETYALIQDGRGWKLDGADLAASAGRAQEERQESRFSTGTADVLDAAKTFAGPFTARDVAAALGHDETKSVGTILRNLANASPPVLTRPARGQYQLAGGLSVSAEEMFGA